jgi:hypothetical protein
MKYLINFDKTLDHACNYMATINRLCRHLCDSVYI